MEKVKDGIDASSQGLFASPWLLFGIISSIGIVLLLIFTIIKWSNKEGQKEVDNLISKMIARSLSMQLNTKESEIIAILKGGGNSNLISQFREVIDSVKVTVTKTKIGQSVEISVFLKYKKGKTYSASSNIVWEELPGDIRESLIRSETNTLTVNNHYLAKILP